MLGIAKRAIKKGNRAALGRRDSWRDRLARKIEERLHEEGGDKLPLDQFIVLVDKWIKIKLPERKNRA
jgi:hypothetical protein